MNRISLSQAEVDVWTESMGPINLDAPIFLWLGGGGVEEEEEEETSRSMRQHHYTPSPDRLARMVPPVWKRAELNPFSSPLGGFDCAVLLWLGVDPARIFPQYEMLQIPPPQQLSMTLQTRATTLLELESFTDPIRGIDFDAIILWQGSHPASLLPHFPMFQTLPPPPPPSHVVLTEAEFAAFTDDDGGSGRGLVDYYSYLLGYQSKGGLSEEGISKLLKTVNVDQIRDYGKICGVCLDYVVCSSRQNDDDDDKVAILDECGHEFHSCCLAKWLRRKNICPLCRTTAISLCPKHSVIHDW